MEVAAHPNHRPFRHAGSSRSARVMVLRAGKLTLWAVAGACLPLAVVLIVLADDVLRASGRLQSDEARFQTMPLRQAGLWDVGGLLPHNASERLLGLEDDVAYRELAGLYLKVEPGRVDWQGFPELEALRAKAQYELTLLSRNDRDLERRSRLLTLYGVMTLDERISRPEERKTLLLRAVSAFTNAIELDPENEDAKTNLETALRAFGFVAIPGNLPGGGREGGPISGQGTSGSGY